MAGNSWQQPVSGQPSLGTLHYCASTVLVNNVDPAGTGVTAVDCSGSVPVGCKAIHIQCHVRSNTTAGRTLRIHDSDGSTQRWDVAEPVVNIYACGSGIAYLDASRNMYWSASNADVNLVYIAMDGYFI